MPSSCKMNCAEQMSAMVRPEPARILRRDMQPYFHREQLREIAVRQVTGVRRLCVG